MSKPWKPTKTCPKCGFMIDKKAKECRKCYDEKRRLFIPEKEDLVSKILESKGNFLAVGRYYHVSDNAVRKWCRSYGLSTSSFDYRYRSPIA